MTERAARIFFIWRPGGEGWERGSAAMRGAVAGLFEADYRGFNGGAPGTALPLSASMPLVVVTTIATVVVVLPVVFVVGAEVVVVVDVVVRVIVIVEG